MATNEIQSDLFGEANIISDKPLKDSYVGFIGRFSKKDAIARRCVELGAINELNKKGDKYLTGLTRKTSVLFVGTNVTSNENNKLLCLQHDGWNPLILNKDDLDNIIQGRYSGYNVSIPAQKNINIGISHYRWTPPTMDEDEDGGNSNIRKSSPIVYGEQNPIYGLEMFVPNIPGVNMNVFRQIIGNLGGYANAEYYDETNVILLGDETLRKLEQGIKDDTIRYIEDKYNNGSSPMFNVQFTCESDFIAWVEKRVEKFNDESTRKLLEAYHHNKR